MTLRCRLATLVFGAVLCAVAIPTVGMSQEPGVARQGVTMAGAEWDTAVQGFTAWKRSVDTGEGDAFEALMSPDVTFTVNIGGRWRGPHRGLAAVRELTRWRWNDLRMRAPMQFRGTAGSEGRAMLEFTVDGAVADGQPLAHHLAIVIDIRDGRIAAFREYAGIDFEPEEKLAARGYAGLFGGGPAKPAVPYGSEAGRVVAPRPQPIDARDLRAAQAAYAAFAHAFATGESAQLLALLPEDVAFSMSAPGRWRGLHTGRDVLRELLGFRAGPQDLRARATLVSELTGRGVVAFEYRLAGSDVAGPFDRPFLVAFDVAEGQVRGLREYYGQSAETAESYLRTSAEAVFGPLPTVQGAQGAEEMALRRLDSEFFAALPRQDVAVAERVLAPDFVAVLIDGAVADRAGEIERNFARNRLEWLAPDQTTVHWFGPDLLVLTSRVTVKPEGGSVQRSRTPHVYARRSGEWRMIHGSAHAIAAEAGAPGPELVR